MSEKMKLHVTRRGCTRVALFNADDEHVATVWTDKCRDDAEYICAAVNAYDPDAVPATVSESQWISLEDKGINGANLAEWSANYWLEETPTLPRIYYWMVGDTGEHMIERVDAVLFLRYMQRAMGDAFPAALRELLS